MRATAFCRDSPARANVRDPRFGELLDDVGEALAQQDVLPQVCRLVSVGVGRIALAEVEALIERQEVGVVARKLGGHARLVGIDGEMHKATAKLE